MPSTHQENSGAGGVGEAGASSTSSSCQTATSVSPPALTSSLPPSANASAVTACGSSTRLVYMPARCDLGGEQAHMRADVMVNGLLEVDQQVLVRLGQQQCSP